MKCYAFTILALLAVTMNSVQAGPKLTNEDCSEQGSTCPNVDCCGVAVPTAGSFKKVCFSKSATQWTDENNNNKVYSFSCPANSVGTEDTGASTLLMGTSAFVMTTAMYMLA